MYLFTFFQKQKHCISSYDLSSTNNTTDLESTKFRATIESLWKKIVNQQNINWLTKPQQYILQHQIIDLLKTNLPIIKNVCFVSFYISPVLNSNRSLFLKCKISKLDFSKIIKNIFQFSSFVSIYQKFLVKRCRMALKISCQRD